jgi:type IV secretory pathway VirD2 relaxase
MSFIEDEFDAALSSPVKRKANKTGQLRHKADRVAKGVPEVMAKVTGFGKGVKHVQAHLDYITRNGNVDMENDRGEVFTGKDQVRSLFNDWAEEFTDSRRHKHQRDTMHMVLSMPEGTEPEAVRAATRHFARKTFGQNHEYVFALHTDEPHPHCHVTVKCLGFNGRRLNPRKDDLHAWREGFAQAMQEQGYEATATPRRSRGVVRKAEKSVVRHIERGDRTHAPRTPKVKAALIKEVADELLAETKGQASKPRPWEEKIKARQTAVRRAWRSAAEELDKTGVVDDKKLAERIKGFVEAMPRIYTQRDETRLKLIERFRRSPDRGQNAGIGQLAPPAAPIPKPNRDQDLER